MSEMMNAGRWWPLTAWLTWALCVGGCDNKREAAPAEDETAQPLPAAGDCQATAELAALDQRTPLPLQPMMAWHQKQNMQEHLVAIQRITAGLANQDWEEVARASALIESSTTMEQTCEHMGAGAQGFTEMALDFHRRANAIGEAARARDTVAVLKATSHTLQSCTSCHAAFRQEVVVAAEWQRRTGRDHNANPTSSSEDMHGAH